MSCCSNNNDGKTCCSCKSSGGMWKICILIIIAILAGVIIYAKKTSPNTEDKAGNSAQAQVAKESGLPTFIELGAEKCIPCKMMKPIIDDFQVNYSNSLKTIFYDVWQNPEMGEKFKIQIIPVQVFLDKNGNEIYRHEGYFPKDDILSKFKELGYELKPNK